MKIIAATQLLDDSGLPRAQADQKTLTTIMADIFVIIGGLAVLIIVISGVRYIFARGNPEKLTQIRNTLLYAVIGLVIAGMAAAFINFILDKAY